MTFKLIQKILAQLHHLAFHHIQTANDLALVLKDSPQSKKNSRIIYEAYIAYGHFLDPLLIESTLGEQFILFFETSSFYLLGPYRSTKQFSQEPELASYQQSLVYISPNNQKLISDLIYFLLYQREESTLLLPHQVKKNALPDQSTPTLTPEINKHQSSLEDHLLNAVYHGHTLNVQEILKSNPLNKDNDTIGLLSKKSLIRHYRNISITTVTLATRAAIQGGALSESAYRLSDYYIQLLEDTHFVTDLSLLMEQALLKLTQSVKQERLLNYGPLTNKAREYISQHLYNQLTRQDVARYLKITPNHLDKVFKAETTQSISSYIKKEKLRLAIHLIEQDSHQLSEIADSLSFSSLNSFSKFFKKELGYAPSQHLKQKKTSPEG